MSEVADNSVSLPAPLQQALYDRKLLPGQAQSRGRDGYLPLCPPGKANHQSQDRRLHPPPLLEHQAQQAGQPRQRLLHRWGGAQLPPGRPAQQGALRLQEAHG